MFEDFTVAVKVKLFNEVSGGLMLMSKQFESVTGKAIKLQTALDGIRSRMMVGGKILGGGFALAAPFVYAISKAAELQKQMLGVQIATHGSVKEMEDLRVSIENASSNTMFSSVDVAKMAKIVATSNAFTTPQLTALMPAIAQFADVQKIMKDTPYSSSVPDAVKLMHLAQHYDPKNVVPYFNELTKASFMMPGGIGELRHALAYYMPMGKEALGVDDKSSIMLVALLNRLGLSGSRGGTNLLAAMTRTIPGVFGSGLLKGKSYEALSDMGFIDKKGHSKFMTNGAFDTDKWVQGLSAFVRDAIAKDPAHGRERVMIDFQHAFGVQGSKVAALLSSPQAIDQLSKMGGMFQQLADMGAIQNDFVTKSVSQQYQTAMTNFQNTMIELGVNLLPMATMALNAVNHGLNTLIPWMREHKTLVLDLSKAFLGLAAAMAIGGLVTILTSEFIALGLSIYALYKIVKLIQDDLTLYNKTTNSPDGHLSYTSSGFWSEFNPFGDNLGKFKRNSGTPVTINTNVIMKDVGVIGKAITKFMTKELAKPQSSSTTFNPNAPHGFTQPSYSGGSGF